MKTLHLLFLNILQFYYLQPKHLEMTRNHTQELDKDEFYRTYNEYIWPIMDGTITTENTLEVVLLDFDNKMTSEWVADKANAIKVALNQESVAYQVEDIKSELI